MDQRTIFPRTGGWPEGSFEMIQVHDIYYYISSTSNHRAFDPGGWGPLVQRTPTFASSLFNLCLGKKAQAQVCQNSILPLYHTITHFTSYLKLPANCSNIPFHYPNDVRHRY